MGKRKWMKPQKWLLLAICAGTMLAGGCASEEAMANKMLKDTMDAEGYARYEKLLKEGKIAEDGSLIKEKNDIRETVAAEEQPEGTVCVSFARNSLLDISYFTDAELTKKIDTEHCYLYPNDCIYAVVSLEMKEHSDRYYFSGFQVYAYGSEGKKTLKDTVALQEDGLVYQIPMLPPEQGFAIVPVGEYEKRLITLHDYIVKSTGDSEELNGTWVIDNKNYEKEEVEISSLNTFGVSYQYNGDRYYFVSASPKALYPMEAGEDDGIVVFYNQEPGKAAESFSVELREYSTASIDNKSKGLSVVFIKDRKETVTIENEMKIPKLQCGSVLELTLKEGYKLICESNPDMLNLTKTEQGDFYSIKLPEEGKMDLQLSVKKIESKKIPVSVSSKDEFEKTWKPLLTEEILQIYCGGKAYKYSELLGGQPMELFEGQKVEIAVSKNLPENCQVNITINNKDSFTVNATSEEFRKTIEYKDIRSLNIVLQNLSEMGGEQNSKWTVKLDKSLKDKKSVLFNIDALEVANRAYTESKNPFDSIDRIVDNKVIDAAQDVLIEVSGTQLLANEVLKLEIKKDNQLAEVRYCVGRDLREIITSKDVTGNYCTNIEVTISVVEKIIHAETTIGNGIIGLCFADADRKEIKNGDFVEVSRNVILTITAKDGYYIENNKSTFVYQEEMKYSAYTKDIEKILKDNPIKKLVKVTLDDTVLDQCGTVTFKIDGEEKRAGTYFLKEGAKVEVTLTISKDSGYGIVNEMWGINVVNKYLQKDSETDTISAEDNETVIRAEDYMKVEKKGE